MSGPLRNWTADFYWIGVGAALACFALVPGGNTEPVWRFEHRGFPLSWTLAGVSVLAFLAAELGESAFSVARVEPESASSQLSPEFEAAEP
jgi:hypothetical protein